MIQLLIGYTMTHWPHSESYLKDLRDSIKAPANYSKPEKINEYIETKFAELQAESASMPYTGTFKSVWMIDTSAPGSNPYRWVAEKRYPFGQGKSISASIADFLLSKWPAAFEDNSSIQFNKSDVVFVGFEMKRFVKVLGLECSMPENKCPLPPVLWYGTDSHRDVAEMIAPKSLGVDLKMALKFRGLINDKGAVPVEHKSEKPESKEETEKRKKYAVIWKGPCQDAEADLVLTTEIMTQLNFIRKPIAE